MSLKFEDLSAANLARCEAPEGFNHKLRTWSAGEWMCAAAGELGEAANVIKKMMRIRDGVPGNGDLTYGELRKALMLELADTVIYLDLLATSEGINLGDAVRQKFNMTSAKIGYTKALL